ncbi:MAG: nucleotidyltransferase family protein [Actinomycetota bacterium]
MVRQAVILAGGKATRMRPHTDERPKAMVEIAGKPIVERQIAWLVVNRIEHVVISCGYRAEMLSEHLGRGRQLGVDITYAVESEPLGRGGGLKYASRSLPFPEEPWLAMNGDILTDFPISELVAQHDKLEAAATIALAPYATTWGIAELEGDLVRGFVQSPRLPYWINGGVYLMEAAVAGMLPDKGDHEDSTFPELAKAGRLGGYRIEGYWRGIDTAKDIIEATAEVGAA